MALSFCGKRLFLTRSSILSSAKRNEHGYIILVPEIGEDLPDKNPLNQNNGLPEFNNITIETCRAAIAKQTLDFEAGVKKIEESLAKRTNPDVFKDVFEPLEELGTNLDTTWGLSKTLYLGNSTLMPTTSYIAIHDRAKRARASKFYNLAIYNAAKTALESTDKHRSTEQNRILQKFTLEGKLNGLDLAIKPRTILTEHLNKLNAERGNFKMKTEISTKQFQKIVHDPNFVRDFPEDVRKAMVTETGGHPEEGPWKITLQSHIYMPVMEYCHDREMRWNLWQTLVSRGSNYRDSELTTSLHLEEIRYLRRSIANVLGFETFADMSMETKMAGSVANVKNMIQTLLERSKGAQDAELVSLLAFAQDRGFKYERLELWDVPYWRRKQAKALFNYSDAAIKDYLPLPKVLEGLFQLSEKLFNIVIRQRSDVTTWHKDVKFYDIFEPHSSAPIGGFYVDPYQRSEDKLRVQNNGWMVGIQNHSRIANKKPIAALVFNFEPPKAERQSHLTFQEVKALFHKFGHALQHLLTRTSYSEVAGLSNVEWDAVEVSGHVLSHWLYNKSVIDSISSHCDSEDKMSPQMYQSLVDMHQHMAGLDLSRELYLSALDMEMYNTKDYWLDIIKRMWPQYRSFPLDKLDSHPCSFTQVVTDEWGAAYYSHVWSRMIAADVYSAFHEVQDDERKIVDVGKRYRDTFLALGGSIHSSQIFRQFRGRDPSPKALLSSLGLKKKKLTEAKVE